MDNQAPSLTAVGGADEPRIVPSTRNREDIHLSVEARRSLLFKLLEEFFLTVSEKEDADEAAPTAASDEVHPASQG